MAILHLTILLFAVLGLCNGWTYSTEGDLRTLLYTNNSYEIHVRPLQLTIVSINFAMFSLNNLDIVSQSVKISGYFQMKWLDPRLQWQNDSTYENITFLFSDSDETWVPGIVLMNSVSDLETWDDDTALRVLPNGAVVWNHINQFEVHCESDVTFYPFDTQECLLTVTTWGFTSSEIDLQWDTVMEPALNMDFFAENGEWEYIEYTTSSADLTRGPETYKVLSMTLNFRRRPVFQLINTILPCVSLALLGCFVFRLPADSGEKVGYVLTVLLAYAVYLTLVSASMPTTSVHTSVLSVYLLITMLVGICSALLTIIVLSCHFGMHDQEIPQWVRRLVGGFMASCCHIPVCRRGTVSTNTGVVEVAVQDVSDKDNQLPSNKKEDDDLTWQKVAMILDAFFFKFFILMSIIYQSIFMLTFLIAYIVS